MSALRERYPRIPHLVFAALMRHKDHTQNWRHGGFLTAVLTNDLSGAIGRADAECLDALYEIGCFVQNELPRESWGSHEKVVAWLSSARVPAETPNA